MKQVIDGLLYDTDKAEKLFEFEELGYDLFGKKELQKRTLYRTKNQRFFVHRAVFNKKMFTKKYCVLLSEDLNALSEEEAKDFFTEKNLFNEYLKVFNGFEEA